MAKVQTKPDTSLPVQTIVFQIHNKRTGRAVKTHALNVMPQSFNFSPANRDSLQHTASDIFIDRWGRGAGRLTLTGVFLNETIPPDNQQGPKTDGAARFKDFRDMLEDYTGARNKDSERDILIRVGDALEGPFNRSELEMRIFIFSQTVAPSSNEELAREWYAVHLPGNFLTFNKNVGERHINFPFTLNLVLVRRLDSDPGEALAAAVELDTRDVTELEDEPGRLTKWAGTIGAIAAKAESAVSGAEARIRKAFSVAGSLQVQVSRFLFLMEDINAALDRFLAATDNFITFPYRSVREASDLCRRIYEVYTNVIDFPDPTQGEIKDSLDFLGALLSKPAAFFQPLTDAQGTAYTSSFSVTVEPGTTLAKLENEFGVPAEDIIKLNNLAYPYFDEFELTDGLEVDGRKTLKAGDEVLIPTKAGEGNVNTPPPDVLGTNKTQEERFFGTAWVLDKDGNMRGTSSKTGFLKVSGLDNMVQALRVALSTEKGSIVQHPQYGLERIIGRKATTVELEMFKVELFRQTISDPRVDAVEKLNLEFEQGLASAQIQSRLKNARESVLLNVDGLRVS